MTTRYQFEVNVVVEEDSNRSLVTMEIYDAEDSDPVKLPIVEECAPYYKGMDLETLGLRAWRLISIPPIPLPELDDLIRHQEESNA